MAVVYPLNLSATGKPPGSVGLNHSRLRKTSAPYTGVATSGDIMPFGFFKSSSIVYDIRVSVIDNSASTGAMDVGLYVATFANGGISLSATGGDIDLFASAFVINADIAWPGTSIFTESTTLNDTVHRALPLWDLLSANSSDPGVTYAIAGTLTATVDSSIDMLVDIFYTAGD